MTGSPGMPRAHGWNEIHLGLRMRGGLGRCDAFYRTLAEAIRMLRNFLFDSIGEECRDGRSGTRHRAEQRAHQRAAQHREKRLPELLPAGRMSRIRSLMPVPTACM